MAILTHKHQDLFENVIRKFKKEYFMKNMLSFGTRHGLHNYLNMMKETDTGFHMLVRKYLNAWLEKLDYSFRYMPGRTNTYHVKSFHSRTIMTIFGLITYYRTFYRNKHTGEAYCHVDSLLGFKKYDHFDPYIRALVVEDAADNSFAGAARHISSMIGERLSIEKPSSCISRQTARSFVLNSVISEHEPVQREITPETLFLMFDEKFIHTQNNENKDIMVKHAVVFEDIQIVKGHTSRYELTGKQLFSSSGAGIDNKVLDYVNYVYDIDKIKQIYVMGDGAKWIRNSATNYKFGENTVTFGLDKYHFKQALHLITQHEDLDEIMLEYILDDEKECFISICDSLILKNIHRWDTIDEKREYILNNWVSIRLSYHDNLRCSMEGQISHNIASLMASRPKGYSIKTISILLKNRMAFKNGHNIRKLYLDNYNSSDKKIINREAYDFSIFNHLYEKSPPRIGDSLSFDLNRTDY